MEEEYRIIGDTTYEVSNFGNVRNILTNHILKPRLHSNGYHRVQLYRKDYYIHRLVAQSFIPNESNCTDVDHIDGDKTNNHILNLRWCTRSQNARNVGVYKKRSPLSGFKGVSLNKEKTKWRARIYSDGKEYQLGEFENIEDAVNARKRKVNELWGEFVHPCEKL
jgi:hypothetical protein